MFKYEPKLKKLTINECRSLLGEKMHRTDFLDDLKKDVSGIVIDTANLMIKNSMDSYFFSYNKSNRYFNSLIITISIESVGKGKDFISGNGGHYIGSENGLVDGKLDTPIIEVTIIRRENGEFAEFAVERSIWHEINHLYDDWMWQSCGHENLNLSNGVSFRNNMAKYLMSSDSDITKDIGYCFYLSIWTEENAFLNQVQSELCKLVCNSDNIHEKIKQTSAYRNYNQTYTDLISHLKTCSYDELKTVNSEMWQMRHLCKSPCIKPDRFDSEIFKKMLVKWCESIKLHFMKRYCGAVQYYLDKLMTSRF